MRLRIAALAALALVAGGVSIPIAAHASSAVGDDDTTTLSQLESLLTVASPNLVGYDRALFGDWTYTSGDGCNTRDNLLKATSEVPVTFANNCTVATGLWRNWYDNLAWTSAQQVQIDHLVPLGEAWASGAENWTAAQRSRFANDMAELRVVTSAVNEAKGDQDPASWMPPAASAACEYVALWVEAKWEYSLNIDPSEKAALDGYLSQPGCGDQRVGIVPVWIPSSSSGGVTPSTPPPGGQTVYRFWNPQSGAHFYTISLDERNLIIRTYNVDQWRYEGAAYTAYATQVAGTVPLYRFFSNQYQGHFYTTSAAERDQVRSSYSTNEWNYEGVAFYVFAPDTSTIGTLAVARFWSSDYKQHFYTANADEAAFTKTHYPLHEWQYERDDFAVSATAAEVAPMIDAKNCTDFQNRQQAQDWYNVYVSQYGDVSGLDGNNNGVACDDPAPGAPAPSGPTISANPITAGAFCAASFSGLYGLTSNGTLEQCRTSSADTRLRWRAA